MKTFVKRFSLSRPKVLACCLALAMLCSLFLPNIYLQAETLSDEEEYVLDFDLCISNTDMPYYLMLNKYVASSLEDWNKISINYILDYNGQQQTQTLTYPSEEAGADQNQTLLVSFTDIQIPFEQVSVEYIVQAGNPVVEPECLQYNLKLVEDNVNQQMVLQVPYLCSVGEERILQVFNTAIDPVNVTSADDQSISEELPAEPQDNLSANPDSSADSVNALANNSNKLSFDLYRPSLSALEFESTTYYNNRKDLFVDGSLMNFSVEYELHVEGIQQTYLQSMSYDSESDFFQESVTFEDINIPTDKVKIEYYPENGEYVKPYLSHYDLYLEASPDTDEMVLKIPNLEPSKKEYLTTPSVRLNVKPYDPTPVEPTIPAIYLGGENASDNNSGYKAEEAVQTFAKAIELAKKYKSVTQIIVLSPQDISGDVSLSGTNAKLVRAEKYYGALLIVSPGNTANLFDITIDGNCGSNSPASNTHTTNSLIEVNSNATLNIGEGVVLENNKILEDETNGKGGAIKATSATINMTGGLIRNNLATYGGGIYLFHSVMNFSGGTIQENQALAPKNASGGGILAENASTLNMYGKAQISQNHSRERGGGISLGSIDAYDGSTLVMSGGSIDGNKAGAAGGGIFVQCGYQEHSPSVAYISGGLIKGNQMTGEGDTNKDFGGGAIYVNGPPYNEGKDGELHLTNALINDNISSLEGAGYAACPTSESYIMITNGCAIYGNHRRTPDDVYTVFNYQYGNHLGSPHYRLSRRMLGGIPYNWKNIDGSLLPDSQYEKELYLTENNSFLDLHTDERGNALTQKLARVFITGNSSTTRGGAIGSDGTVVLGEPDTTKVTVEKRWADGEYSNSQPKSIEVELYIELDGQDYVIDRASLSASNQWRFTFEDLPKAMGNLSMHYQVREVSVPGYVGSITGDALNGFIITNTPATPPTTPSNPEYPHIDIPIKVTVKKVWEDQDNQAGLRPNKVTVKLYADGKDTGKFIFLEPEQNWIASFWELPAYNGDHKIEYTVQEEPVANYESQITSDIENNFVLTNTLTGQPLKSLPEKVRELPRTGESYAEAYWISWLMLASGLAITIKKHNH